MKLLGDAGKYCKARDFQKKSDFGKAEAERNKKKVMTWNKKTYREGSFRGTWCQKGSMYRSPVRV
jgi:hypothetical protein